MNVAIIVAAGQGTRMGTARPKQFLELAGVPVLVHTLRRLGQAATIAAYVVVAPPAETSELLTLAARYELRKLAHVVAGGATRTESVPRGRQAVRAATAQIVAVHDGVRPFVTPTEIDETVRAAERTGAALLVAPVVDTIKEIESGQVARSLAPPSLRPAM